MLSSRRGSDLRVAMLACCQRRSVAVAVVKVGLLYSATHMVDQEQRALTTSEVAVDWQEPVVV